MKKISIYIFIIFPVAVNEKKKRNEKKIGAEPFLGYCPNYIVKKKNLYCKRPIVLQRKRNFRADCIAIQYFVL